MFERQERAISLSVIPPHPRYANNALFEARLQDDGPHTPNVHWMDYFAAFAEAARRANINPSTADVLPVERAAAVMYVGRTPDRAALRAMKQQNPAVPWLL